MKNIPKKSQDAQINIKEIPQNIREFQIYKDKKSEICVDCPHKTCNFCENTDIIRSSIDNILNGNLHIIHNGYSLADSTLTPVFTLKENKNAGEKYQYLFEFIINIINIDIIETGIYVKLKIGKDRFLTELQKYIIKNGDNILLKDFLTKDLLRSVVLDVLNYKLYELGDSGVQDERILLNNYIEAGIDKVVEMISASQNFFTENVGKSFEVKITSLKEYYIENGEQSLDKLFILNPVLFYEFPEFLLTKDQNLSKKEITRELNDLRNLLFGIYVTYNSKIRTRLHELRDNPEEKKRVLKTVEQHLFRNSANVLLDVDNKDSIFNMVETMTKRIVLTNNEGDLAKKISLLKEKKEKLYNFLISKIGVSKEIALKKDDILYELKLPKLFKILKDGSLVSGETLNEHEYNTILSKLSIHEKKILSISFDNLLYIRKNEFVGRKKENGKEIVYAKKDTMVSLEKIDLDNFKYRINFHGEYIPTVNEYTHLGENVTKVGTINHGVNAISKSDELEVQKQFGTLDGNNIKIDETSKTSRTTAEVLSSLGILRGDIIAKEGSGNQIFNAFFFSEKEMKIDLELSLSNGFARSLIIKYLRCSYKMQAKGPNSYTTLLFNNGNFNTLYGEGVMLYMLGNGISDFLVSKYNAEKDETKKGFEERMLNPHNFYNGIVASTEKLEKRIKWLESTPDTDTLIQEDLEKFISKKFEKFSKSLPDIKKTIDKNLTLQLGNIEKEINGNFDSLKKVLKEILNIKEKGITLDMKKDKILQYYSILKKNGEISPFLLYLAKIQDNPALLKILVSIGDSRRDSFDIEIDDDKLIEIIIKKFFNDMILEVIKNLKPIINLEKDAGFTSFINEIFNNYSANIIKKGKLEEYKQKLEKLQQYSMNNNSELKIDNIVADNVLLNILGYDISKLIAPGSGLRSTLIGNDLKIIEDKNLNTKFLLLPKGFGINVSITDGILHIHYDKLYDKTIKDILMTTIRNYFISEKGLDLSSQKKISYINIELEKIINDLLTGVSSKILNRKSFDEFLTNVFLYIDKQFFTNKINDFLSKNIDLFNITDKVKLKTNGLLSGIFGKK